MIMKSKRAGTILKSILHSRRCKQGKDCDAFSNCYALKKLLRHCVQCRLNAEGAAECKISGCKTVRALLDHMLSCQAASCVARSQSRELPACIICTIANVEDYQQRENGSRNLSSSPPTSVETTPDEPSAPIFRLSDERRVHMACAAEDDGEDDGYAISRIQSFRPSWTTSSTRMTENDMQYDGAAEVETGPGVTCDA